MTTLLTPVAKVGDFFSEILMLGVLSGKIDELRDELYRRDSAHLYIRIQRHNALATTYNRRKYFWMRSKELVSIPKLSPDQRRTIIEFATGSASDFRATMLECEDLYKKRWPYDKTSPEMLYLSEVFSPAQDLTLLDLYRKQLVERYQE